MSIRGVKKGGSAIITGASTGIGKALAVMLAAKYQTRVIMNSRGAEELEAACKLVRDAGGEAIPVLGDVSDANLRKSLVDTCVEKFGGVDALVNNAGLARSGSMEGITEEDWRYVFEVNFFAPLSLTYLALPHLKQSSRGKIVNVASVAGKVSFPGSVCYASSKFALTGMSEGMAAEYAGTGLDVLTVCPGWVRTEFFKKNSIADNPTTIAGQSDMKGWLMRNVLSISSEQCAADILKALEKGGSHEIVLTLPGKMVERIAGVSPGMMQYLSTFVPANRGTRTKTE